MARPLSPNVTKAVERLFSGESKAEVVRLLTEQCADNLPNCKNEDEYDLEDLRFQVLKLSDGNIEKLRAAVLLANQDWRDLAGSVSEVREYKHQLLGRDLERNPKSDAVRRGQIHNIAIATTAYVTFLVLRQCEASGRKLLGATVLLLAAFVAVDFRVIWDRSHEGTRIPILLIGTFTFVGVPAVLGVLTASIIREIVRISRSFF